MARGATLYHWPVTLSDVDRQTYVTLDVRLARHPSESLPYLLTRWVAYCLSYEEGIAFSRGGVSDADEPPVSIYDAVGRRTAWIDVGIPGGDRLHRATKATPRVAVFTDAKPSELRRVASSRPIHRADEIVVWRLDSTFLAELAARLNRYAELELVRSDGRLYVTVQSATLEAPIERTTLAPSGSDA